MKETTNLAVVLQFVVVELIFRAGAVQKNGILIDLATLPLPWSGSGHGGTRAPTREPQINTAVPGGSDGKESASNAGDLGSIPGLGRSSGEGNGNLLQYFCFREFHGQRSLAGYSPWGHACIPVVDSF